MERKQRVVDTRSLGASPRAVATLMVLVCVITTSALLIPVAVNAANSCANLTLRVGASAALADCRAYEMVSPVDKGGFAAYPTQSTPVQISSTGDALAYLNFAAFPGAEGNTALYSAHVSERTIDGWRTAEWTPRLPKATALKGYKVNYVFSSDLSQAILQIPLIPLTPDATPNASNLFLRDRTNSYSLVNSATPAKSVEELCSPGLLGFCWGFIDIPTYAGASSDFSHVFFESNAQLTPEAPTTGISSLYEKSGQHVRLVGILPDDHPATRSTAGAGSNISYVSSAQESDRSVERAISRDGSHVIFQAPSDNGSPDPEQDGQVEVYDRIDGTKTIELSAPAPGATPAVNTPEPATFQTASLDGSRVYFTSSAELTTQSNTGPGNNSEDLYEYNLTTGQLKDITVDTTPTDATTGAMVEGVVDSSVDGSYVYFVAYGQLIEGKGVDHQPNLYLVHDGGNPVFIATLSSTGTCHFSASETADSCDWSPFPVVREAYVTPDGTHIAFMSTKSLPTVTFPNGYDTIDQETDVADSEVYEYTAPTRPGGTGQLVCASCDPTGYRPIGNALIGGISPNGGLQEGRPTLSGISTPFARVRALSDDGQRLFYIAPASLSTPYDRVYEYESNGNGSCLNVSGCHNLISEANTTESDYFLGASADGKDLYFATASRLTATDQDNLRDIYDARVDGGIPSPVAEVHCEAGCRQTSPTQVDPPLSTDTVGSSANLQRLTPTTQCKKGFKRNRARCVKARKTRKKHGRPNPNAANKKRRAH